LLKTTSNHENGRKKLEQLLIHLDLDAKLKLMNRHVL